MERREDKEELGVDSGVAGFTDERMVGGKRKIKNKKDHWRRGEEEEDERRRCVPGVQQGKEVIGWRQAGHFSISLSSVALSFSSPPLLRAGLRQLDSNHISCIEDGAFRALRDLEIL
ncbi:hypothetical protein D4764_09G0003610 [Takifugu flavidus]|uniref:Uncharacterized protein n=1 Tax=Takifugu flavidus TaxID=433684 RepID=A0A5C6MJL3_9TELE|nr:hypothetical protein D4764_09G0003610 [Takifugu flavidus]